MSLYYILLSERIFAKNFVVVYSARVRKTRILLVINMCNEIRSEARTEFDSENVEFETTLLANDEQFGLKVERSTFKLCIHQVAASLQASSFKSQMLSNPGFHCHSPQEFSLFHAVSILLTWRDAIFLYGLEHENELNALVRIPCTLSDIVNCTSGNMRREDFDQSPNLPKGHVSFSPSRI
ncbi:hypothetical protein C8Q75DRAFT_736074 [Abortiporus biennis]|nr:hypothetical protein C8Q75DRAFT_736074 [Abortiporus biennis]